MLQDQHNVFAKAQHCRQKEFDENVGKKKDVMTIHDMEDERLFKKAQKTYQETVDAWELELVQAFNAQEKEREEASFIAEKQREKQFLQMAEAREDFFDATVSKFESAFFGLVEGLEKKAYQHEGIRLKNVLGWGHVQKHEVKRSVDMWRRRFAEAEEGRWKRFRELLRSAGV